MDNGNNYYDNGHGQDINKQDPSVRQEKVRNGYSDPHKRYRTMKAGFIAVSVLLVVLIVLSGLFFHRNYTLFQEELGKARKSLSETNDALKEKNEELEQVENKLSSRDEELTSIKKEFDLIKEENDKLSGDLDVLKQENESLKKELEDLKAEKEKQEQQSTAKIAYLTFDDGVSKNTPELLEVLDRYGVKATFFPNWKPSLKEYYKLIVDKGHALGNHTATHEWGKVYSSLEGFKDEVKTLEDNVYEVTGVRPTLFRFPGGTNNTKNFKYNGRNTELIPNAIEWLTSGGYSYFDWNVDSGDADGKKYTADEIASHVLSQAKGKQVAVILMHDAFSKHTTIEALPKIIEGLKAQGFTFEVLTKDSKPVHFKPAS